MPDATSADDPHLPAGVRPNETEVYVSTKSSCEPCPEGETCKPDPACVPQRVRCEDFGTCSSDEASPAVSPEPLIGVPVAP